MYNRLKEPSSYAGLAALLIGVGQIFQINEVEPLAQTAQQAAEAVAQSGSPAIGLGVLITGVLAFFLPEWRSE